MFSRAATPANEVKGSSRDQDRKRTTEFASHKFTAFEVWEYALKPLISIRRECLYVAHEGWRYDGYAEVSIDSGILIPVDHDMNKEDSTGGHWVRVRSLTEKQNVVQDERHFVRGAFLDGVTTCRPWPHHNDSANEDAFQRHRKLS